MKLSVSMLNFLPALVLFLLHGSLTGDASGRAVERALNQSAFARELARVCQVWQEQEVAALPEPAPKVARAKADTPAIAAVTILENAPRTARHDRAGPVA